MNATNRKLLVAALVLLPLSIATYWNDMSRADRFERGRKLMPNLNPDEIAAIQIRSGKGTVSLSREGDSFVITEEKGYRARNDEVNRLLRDLQAVTLGKRLGEGDGLARELGFGSAIGDADTNREVVATATESPLELRVEDATGGEMVRLQIGADSEAGDGTFVRRLDGDDRAIYLTEEGLRFATTPDRFLEKVILDVEESEVVQVQGGGFRLARDAERGNLKLVDLPPGSQANSAEVRRVADLLSPLRFEEVFLADDGELGDLHFEDAFRYELEDGSGYLLQAATAGERTFVRVSGFHTVDRVEIAMDTSEAELEEKADVLRRADEIQRFNADHGPWTYAVDQTTAESLAIRLRDLIAAAG